MHFEKVLTDAADFRGGDTPAVITNSHFGIDGDHLIVPVKATWADTRSHPLIRLKVIQLKGNVWRGEATNMGPRPAIITITPAQHLNAVAALTTHRGSVKIVCRRRDHLIISVETAATQQGFFTRGAAVMHHPPTAITPAPGVNVPRLTLNLVPCTALGATIIKFSKQKLRWLRRQRRCCVLPP